MKRLLIFAIMAMFVMGTVYAQEVQQPQVQTPAPEVKQETKQEQKKDDKPEWKLEFTIFTGYLWNPSTIQNSATNYNTFYLSRAYIDFRVDFKNGLKLRVTPDVTPTTSGWTMRLRHAFIDWELIKDLLVFSGGITRAEWVSYVDDFVGIRYITTSPADYFGLRTSVDIGASLSITPIKGIGIFAGIFDGNGFSRGPDSVQSNIGYSNVTKDLGTRVTLAPIFLLTGDKKFEKIVVALHTYNTIIPTSDMKDARGLELYGLGLGIDFDPVKLFADYSAISFIRLHSSPTYGNYFGVFGKANFGFIGIKELALVGAFYTYEPNVDNSNDERIYYLGGIEYAFNKNLSSSLNAKIEQRKEGFRDFFNNKVDYQTVVYIDTLIKL
ncbi:MAG: hypothetical protein N2712_06200 [Brevinematales bacterium]|nr:hypothetical protein [Brevinematales bacterium]